LITGILGVLIMPWKLLSDANAYIFGWLVGYSSLLGPIAGIMIADYFVLRGRSLDLEGLYLPAGPYRYSNGVNWRAVAALICGIAVALIGLIFEPLRWLYDYAWFVGFAVSALLYLVWMRGERIK
jgi:NCS1 family nucleobase:cation symporter-1